MQEEERKSRKTYLAIVVIIDLVMLVIFLFISQGHLEKMFTFLVIMLAFIDGVFLLVAVFQARKAKKVDEKWGALAEKMGWDYSLNVEFTQPDGRSEKQPGIIGKYGGRRINITEFISLAGDGQVQTIVATQLSKAPRERLVIHPKVAIPFLGGQPLVSKEFDRKYAVNAKDREYAKRVLSGIQGKIISSPMQLTLQAANNLAVAATPGTLTDERKIMQLADILVSFADAVERVE